jgi:hypothetical protein
MIFLLSEPDFQATKLTDEKLLPSQKQRLFAAGIEKISKLDIVLRGSKHLPHYLVESRAIFGIWWREKASLDARNKRFRHQLRSQSAD